MEGWKCTFTHLWVRHLVQMNVQLQVPAGILPNKNPVSIEYELGEAPIYFGKFGEKYFAVAGNPIKIVKNEDDTNGPLEYQLTIVGYSNSELSYDYSVFWDLYCVGG
jgi:hypothetical protein